MSTLSSLPKQFLSRSAQKSQKQASHPLVPAISLPASLTNIAVPVAGAGIVLFAMMVLFSSSGTRRGSVRQDFDNQDDAESRFAGGDDNEDIEIASFDLDDEEE
jgi:hypothetical protein